MGTARCCCECEACRIFFDDFNRAEGTGTGSLVGLGPSWQETFGDWYIDNNTLNVASSNAIVAVVDPQHDTPYVWSVKIKGNDFSDEIRVGAGISLSHIVYARVRLQSASGLCGELSLYSYDGGTHTLITSVQVPGLTPNEWHKVSICLRFEEEDEYGSTTLGEVAAIVATKSGIRRRISYSALSALYNNPRVGLGTGTITSLVEFDDACWQRHKTIEDSVEDVIETGTGTGSGTGTGTMTVPAEPGCPTCTYRDGCDWGNLYTEDQPGTGIISPPCDWLEESGVWEAIPALAVKTDSADAILQFLTPTPNSGTRQRLVAAIKGTVEGSQATLYVNYKSSTENLAGRATFSNTCGKLQILKDGIEVDYLNVEPLSLNEWHFLCVSYDGETLRADLAPFAESEHEVSSLAYRHLAAVVAGSGESVGTGTGTGVDAGIYVAIGTGDNTGTVLFSDVVASFPYHPTLFPDCRTCDNCGLGKPVHYAVTTAGCEWGPISGTVTHETDIYGTVRIDSSGGYAAYKGNDGSPNAYSEFNFKATASGQKLRTYINDPGDLTGPWAEIEVNAAPANSVLRLSTGQTKNTTAIRPGDTSNMLICLDGTSIRANLGVSLTFSPPLKASVTGTLGSSATGKYLIHQLLGTAGESRFTRTHYHRMRSDHPVGVVGPLTCGRCYEICSCCINDLMPGECLVEFENIIPMGECDPSNAMACIPNSFYVPVKSGCGYATGDIITDVCGGCVCRPLDANEGAPVGKYEVAVSIYCSNSIKPAFTCKNGISNSSWPVGYARLHAALFFGIDNRICEFGSYCGDQYQVFDFWSDLIPEDIDCLNLDRLELFADKPDFSLNPATPFPTNPCHPLYGGSFFNTYRWALSHYPYVIPRCHGESILKCAPDPWSADPLASPGTWCNQYWTPGNARCFLSAA